MAGSSRRSRPRDGRSSWASCSPSRSSATCRGSQRRPSGSMSCGRSSTKCGGAQVCLRRSADHRRHSDGHHRLSLVHHPSRARSPSEFRGLVRSPDRSPRLQEERLPFFARFHSDRALEGRKRPERRYRFNHRRSRRRRLCVAHQSPIHARRPGGESRRPAGRRPNGPHWRRNLRADRDRLSSAGHAGGDFQIGWAGGQRRRHRRSQAPRPD